MSSLLLKNGTIVTSKKIFDADIYIENGIIAAIGKSISFPSNQTIDIKGLHVFPGVIDPQVHFREPGFEWKEDLETGSKAAAAGGVTSFFEMPNTKPATTTAQLIDDKKKRASEKSLVNYNFFIGATNDNIYELNSVKNVPGIKIFMGSSTGDLLIDNFSVLEKIFKNGSRLIAVHAEDEKLLQENKKKFISPQNVHLHALIRSPEVAFAATKKAVELSKKYQRRLHILHLTSEEEVKYLEKEKNNYITAETTPQHLYFSAPDVYDTLRTYGQMNPPIREQRHQEALWYGLKNNIIDCIATDHAPHTKEEKEKPYPESPSGMPGIETSLPIMLHCASQGKCTLQNIAKWMSENPAIIYKIQNKGFISEGFDADLVIVDLKTSKVIDNDRLYTKVKWSPFHGIKTSGWPIITIVNGNIVYREGQFFSEIKGKEVLFYE